MILNSHTAIYAQNGTIDIGRFVGCEVEIGGGDLLGTPQATYGNFGPHAVEYVLGHLGNHFGSMKPGATALTVMPLRPSSRAIVLVMPIRPAFVAT